MEKERYWTFIIYPESVREDYKEYLRETGLQVAISPLHNKDKNADGTLKKPHYHVVLCFNGPTTYKRVEKIANDINATIPKRVLSLVGIIRYLSHKDNPEKAQYNEEEIVTLNGLDIKDINGITTTMKEAIKREVIHLIRNTEIIEYADLIDFLDNNDCRDMMEIVSNNTIFFNAYLKSRRYKIEIDNKK